MHYMKGVWEGINKQVPLKFLVTFFGKRNCELIFLKKYFFIFKSVLSGAFSVSHKLIDQHTIKCDLFL